MKRYRCTICNYIYDPKVGDPTAEVSVGTAFDELPDTWMCPECGASVDFFDDI